MAISMPRLTPLALALVLAACSGGEGAPPPPGATEVTVVTLKAAPVTLTRERPGRTVASAVAEVRPQVSGIIQRRLFTEGGLVRQGQALYQMQRYADAIPVLQQAIAGATEPKDSWNQLLMAAMSEAGQTGEAVKQAEALAARNPNDKKAQLNLASMYMQADQMDKAASVMDKLRASGQLTEEREYKQLYSIYANTDNKEKDVNAVINEGLQKGILKPDYQVYLALAQSYYYSDQVPQAIDAWQKAAPLSKDGETYLNLARVLHAEGRIPEAKQAAQQALAKGVKNQADAKKIINLK